MFTNEVRDVLDEPVLMVESIVHLLLHVSVVLFEFSDRVRFDALDLVLLSLQLRLQLGRQLLLSLLPALLLDCDGLLNLVGFVREQL